MLSGMDAKNWRMRKMPKTCTAPGAMIPDSVSNPRKGMCWWSQTMIRYCGIRLTCMGIIIVTMSAPKISDLPGKRSLAKA